jgi:hypothetical protein
MTSHRMIKYAGLVCAVLAVRVCASEANAQIGSNLEVARTRVSIMTCESPFKPDEISALNTGLVRVLPVAPLSKAAGGFAQVSPAFDRSGESLGSTYIPVDSWIYPALLRLYSLGYLDTAFLSMRPWTRRSVEHMLDKPENSVRQEGSDEARESFAKHRMEIYTQESQTQTKVQTHTFVIRLS